MFDDNQFHQVVSLRYLLACALQYRYLNNTTPPLLATVAWAMWAATHPAQCQR
jgi:hypothetical protein